MKPSVVMLVISLVANAVCLAVFALAPGSTSAPPDKKIVAGDARPSGAVKEATAAPAADLAALLRADDPAALCEALRAAGVLEETVRAIVREKINARYLARMRALEPGSDAASRPYWQPAARASLTSEQRAERRRLQREMMEETTRLLGTRNTGGASERYNYLSDDKREQLAQVESDYREMIADIRRGMEEFPLKSEQQAVRLLETEQKRDIEALLTPEEKAMIELRTSPAANMVRQQYGAVINSEDEFRAIYALQRAYLERFPPSTGARVDASTHAEATNELKAQINAILGPDRVVALARKSDPDVRMLQAAADKLKLPEAAITQSTLALRAQAAQESQRIASDPSLDAAARRQALGALANQVRAQLQSVLGNDGGDTFADRAGWFSALNRGNAFTVRPEGGVQISRDVRLAPAVRRGAVVPLP